MFVYFLDIFAISKLYLWRCQSLLVTLSNEGDSWLGLPQREGEVVTDCGQTQLSPFPVSIFEMLDSEFRKQLPIYYELLVIRYVLSFFRPGLWRICVWCRRYLRGTDTWGGPAEHGLWWRWWSNL